MKHWVTTFFSEFHKEYLKPLGFRKDGQTFFRDCGAYDERFYFQGSQWSSGDERRFYLNVGVEFHDLEPAITHWLLLRHTHWARRIDEVVLGAPEHWDCTPNTDRESMKRELTGLIVKASDHLRKHIEKCRNEYIVRLKRIQKSKNG